MKNETTGVEEFFVTPEVNEDTEDVVLMSDTEVLEAASVIAQVTASDEKFPFYLHYDANQKEFLLSVLTAAGATIESDDVDNHILSVRMNMTQMKLVRYQDCVERVRTDEGMNTMLADEVIDEDLDAEIIPATVEVAEGSLAEASSLEEPAVVSANAQVMALSVDESISETTAGMAATANSVETTSTCCCPTNTTMETAKTITVESLISGYICCPGTPQWFKFTVPQTAEYTIYTTGDKDTRGALYGSNGQRITHVDDYEPCGKVNFRIIQELQANETYYVRVDIAKSGTGNYQLKVTQKTLVNRVSITPNTLVLDKGVTYELPILPNTYANLEGAHRIGGLKASVVPANAAEQKVTWGSSNANILNISAGWHNGQRYYKVSAVGDGVATLRAYDWYNHGCVGECTVTVITREVATITKDDHSFSIKFANNVTWMNIGVDMSKREDYYPDDPPPFGVLYYDQLVKEEQRYLYNIENKYTVDQLAYLYLFDPLGIEFYMNSNATRGMDHRAGESSLFRDEVYEAIFGTSDRDRGRFFFDDVINGIPQYIANPDPEKRADYYSNAEVLFGFHTICNWDWQTFITSILSGLFDIAVDKFIDGTILKKGSEIVKLLFHSSGILGGCSEQATNYVQDYVQRHIEKDIEEKFGEKAKLTFHWALTLATLLFESALDAIIIPNTSDITIYRKINMYPKYRTVFEGLNSDYLMEDIIDQVLSK